MFDTTAIAVRDALEVLTPRQRAAVVWVVPLRGGGQSVYDRVVGPDGDIDHGGDSACITDLIPTNGFQFLHYPDQVHDRQAESGKVPAGQPRLSLSSTTASAKSLLKRSRWIQAAPETDRPRLKPAGSVMERESSDLSPRTLTSDPVIVGTVEYLPPFVQH